MYRVMLEVACPQHGFERFSIKVVRRYNIPSKNISPRFGRRKHNEISQLHVGRNVTEKEIRRFLDAYLSRTGLREMILEMKYIKVT